MAQKGFTLIELLVSMAIFAIAIVGFSSVFTSQVKQNTRMDIRAGAVAAAQVELDRLRLLDPVSLPSSGSIGPTSSEVDGRTFQITTFFCQNASYCTSTEQRHISVEVQYRGESYFQVETVYTRVR